VNSIDVVAVLAGVITVAMVVAIYVMLIAEWRAA
jgi:hypothetical protein